MFKVLLTVIFISFISAQQPQMVPDFRKVPDFNIDKLQRLIKSGREFLLIDARSIHGYNHGHIPKAISQPADKPLIPMFNTLRKDQVFVIYCAGVDCPNSDILAIRLLKMGFRKVLVFHGGIEEWQKKGLPVVKPKAVGKKNT